MSVITITSDWHNNDHYLPMLIGGVMSLLPGCNVVNVSNTIKPFCIPEACFVLRNSYKNFPEGTIHLLAVNSEPLPNAQMVMVKYDGHWFISPNDGRFSLLLDFGNELFKPEAFLLPQPNEFSTFMTLPLFLKGVELISGGEIEKKLERAVLLLIGGNHPSVFEDRIIGRVVYIDSYGNAITNISKEIFAKGYIKWRANNEADPDFVIHVQGPYLKIYNIHDTYSQVQSGGTVALFNSVGLLELAINNGNFAQVENIDTTAEVMIKFS